MTTPVSPPPLDIVTVLTAVATAIFGQELAQVIGPYSVIVLGALLGGALSAGRRKKEARVSKPVHMATMVGLALLLTVPAAAAAVAVLGLSVQDKWLFGPVAALVAGIGQDWPKVGIWMLDLARRAIEMVVTRRGDPR